MVHPSIECGNKTWRWICSNHWHRNIRLLCHRIGHKAHSSRSVGPRWWFTQLIWRCNVGRLNLSIAAWDKSWWKRCRLWIWFDDRMDFNGRGQSTLINGTEEGIDAIINRYNFPVINHLLLSTLSNLFIVLVDFLVKNLSMNFLFFKLYVTNFYIFNLSFI